MERAIKKNSIQKEWKTQNSFLLIFNAFKEIYDLAAYMETLFYVFKHNRRKKI